MTLELLTLPGKPTRRGQEAQNQRDSTLDLTWHNFAAQVRGTFQGAFVDWEGSHGSDHALIRTFACTPYHVKTPKGDRTNGFNTDIDEDQWVTWHRIMWDASPIVYSPLHSPEEVNTIINLIYEAFNKACSEVMKRKGTSSARSAPWWSDKIGILSRAVQQAPDDETRRAMDHVLKRAVRKAKRTWADSKITSSNVWEVAAWRHSRRMTIIPALKGEEDELVYDHEGMANILSKRFFAKDTGQVPMDLPDDPEPREAQEHVPITEQETLKMLMETSNSSAPGFSGIGYQLLKQACLGWDKIWDGLSCTDQHIQRMPFFRSSPGYLERSHSHGHP